MPILNLTEIKHHLRLDSDDEDAHLSLLAEAAEHYAAEFLDRPVPWLDTEGQPVPVPASVKVALLLIVADLYENREAQSLSNTQQNPALQNLLMPYRIGIGV